MKKPYKNNKFKISVSKWNEESEHEAVADNPSIKIYVNKIENRI